MRHRRGAPAPRPRVGSDRMDADLRAHRVFRTLALYPALALGMDSLAKDLKLSLRLLARTPGFSLAAIAVLAWASGSTPGRSASFTPWPSARGHSPSPIAWCSSTARTGRGPRTTGPFLPGLSRDREPKRPVPGRAGAQPDRGGRRREAGDSTRLLGDRQLQLLRRARGTAGSRAPLHERRERPSSDVPVVVVGHPFWKRTGFDRDLVGKTIRVNERAFTVVGIAPEGFTGT